MNGLLIALLRLMCDATMMAASTLFSFLYHRCSVRVDAWMSANNDIILLSSF